MSSGRNISFQSVTNCDADAPENSVRRCSFQSVTKCVADISKNLQVNVEFPGGITIDFLTMVRTNSMPQIGGHVQRREVTFIGLESWLDNDGLIVGSVSPRPT